MSHGIARERQVRKLLEADGYWTARAAGSLGDADVIALRAYSGGAPRNRMPDVLMIEVKATAGGPYEHFGPYDRAQLKAAAGIAGATPMLCWWPKRAKPQWIPAKDWP